ncbi:MAG: type II toxin-antitoxin system ParD family antitoxin [Leptolyngbya sp.]|nr:MAG: type II toxin-antitoxin system ParD family antitoxin [Leptolyngbya sp.]
MFTTQLCNLNADQLIDEQIATGKYSNASEYIYYLVEQEQERLAREQVEAMLLEGLESGEAIEVTDEWWQQKRDRLIASSLRPTGSGESFEFF